MAAGRAATARRMKGWSSSPVFLLLVTLILLLTASTLSNSARRIPIPHPRPPSCCSRANCGGPCNPPLH
ncbi:hypothetical protein BS78_08G005100 [Paspalum vaginatum]|nr:hypothetical protein BS78_08G005100 [Paspalum vaginatum]